MHPLALAPLALGFGALFLEGCALAPTPASGPSRNFDEGIAATCTASPVDLSASASATATIAMTNDGWCAVRTVEKDGKPFALGLVKVKPAHGTLLVHSFGGQTRIEYTADARYVGPDTFTVALRSRTANVPDATVKADVTVSMGASVAPAPAPAAARAATTPARPAAARSGQTRPATR